MLKTVRVLNELLELLTRPGPLYVIFLEEAMADLIRVRVLFPPVSDADVETRALTITDPSGSRVEAVAKDEVQKEFIFSQNASVTLELRDTDDAGNVSPPSVRTFTALDVIPPAQPGEMGVEFVGEE